MIGFLIGNIILIGSAVLGAAFDCHYNLKHRGFYYFLGAIAGTVYGMLLMRAITLIGG